jgi:hypothetical protein
LPELGVEFEVDAVVESVFKVSNVLSQRRDVATSGGDVLVEVASQ